MSTSTRPSTSCADQSSRFHRRLSTGQARVVDDAAYGKANDSQDNCQEGGLNDKSSKFEICVHGDSRLVNDLFGIDTVNPGEADKVAALGPGSGSAQGRWV